MVIGALAFIGYAVVFFIRTFAASGFELGVDTLNGVTRDQLNPAVASPGSWVVMSPPLSVRTAAVRRMRRLITRPGQPHEHGPPCG
jgi:hypothetical protein